MSYYICSNYGGFISGLYATEADAKRGLNNYVKQQARRYSPGKVHNITLSLNEALKIIYCPDSEAPDIVVNYLSEEIFNRIKADSPGAIYSKPLLLSHIRTRIFSIGSEYWEVLPIMKARALGGLLGESEVLVNDADGNITRGTGSFDGPKSNTGVFKSSAPRY